MKLIYTPLPYFWRPAPNSQQAKTLLLLHRTGGDEMELVEAATAFEGDYNLLGLRGHVSENGKLRFFARLSVGVFDEEDLVFRTDELRQTVLDLSPILGFDLSQLIVVGRSNGANVAGALLQLHPGFLKGAIMLRPSIPLPAITLFPPPFPTPVLVSSGFSDAQEPPDEANRWANLLKNNGFAVTHARLDAGHAVIPMDWDVAYAWWKRTFL
ncbi:MAG TPA: hypothetical protein DIW24_02340 [Bacteroidetes bacterium]|nr:hypothetical protein [Bacteroidota bacterium]HRR10043.1 hypothetical protein [Rhodothermales bacterium]